MRASVVVAVYNTGDLIEGCVDSLVRQTLPAEDYEIILVDDGSDDGTERRLDELAQEHPNLQVIHIPNSGWPGRPRNVGTDRATGDYVHYVDHDDALAPDALERLTGYADRHGSDVVVGKVVGRGGRFVPPELFRHDRPDANLRDDPLLTLLTPHKLFRRSFLVEHGIRFPEGRRRLEDHLFVMAAYFDARRISVLAEHPCYYWIAHGSNASTQAPDPHVFYDSLRDVLDLVESRTEPGPFQDRLLRHWYRGKVLKKLSGQSQINLPEEYRQERFEVIQKLVDERFDPRLDAKLSALDQVRSLLLRAGRRDLVERLAEEEAGYHATSRLLAVESPQARPARRSQPATFDAVTVSFTAALRRADGRVLDTTRREGRAYWAVADEVRNSGLVQDSDVTGALRAVRADLAVASRATGARYLLPTATHLSGRTPGRQPLQVQGSATLDPRTAAADGPLPDGEWDLVARVRGFGVALWTESAGTVRVSGSGTRVEMLTIPVRRARPVPPRQAKVAHQVRRVQNKAMRLADAALDAVRTPRR